MATIRQEWTNLSVLELSSLVASRRISKLEEAIRSGEIERPWRRRGWRCVCPCVPPLELVLFRTQEFVGFGDRWSGARIVISSRNEGHPLATTSVSRACRVIVR